MVGMTGFEPPLPAPCAEEGASGRRGKSKQKRVLPRCYPELSKTGRGDWIRTSDPCAQGKLGRPRKVLIAERSAAPENSWANFGPTHTTTSRYSRSLTASRLLRFGARVNRKRAHANTRRLERHYASALQWIDELGQIREQRSSQCFRLAASLASKLDDGRLLR
jgi:hypothetical protein